MPSVSKKQHNLMEAVAHSPAFAKKVGIKQSVGKDFAAADKGKKFKEGGTMKMESKSEQRKEMKEDVSQDKKMIKKAFSMHDKQEHKGEHTNLSKLKKGGMMKKMAKGGIAKETMGPRSMKSDVEKSSNKNLKHGEHGIQKRGHTKAMMPKMAGKTI